MPRHYRHLSFAVLLALLVVALPAPRPAFAQNIVVTSLGDADNGGANDCGGDGCTLREAIRLANSRGGPNTITFSVTGEIVPASSLPPLTDDATMIDAGTAHNVVLNGTSAGEANGITIRSNSNVIRGLVIYNFFGLDETSAGAGIYINGAPFGSPDPRGDNNQIYGNWIGLNAAGSATISNRGYGIYLTNGASNNVIGADTAADRNVIAGNLSGGMRLFNNSTLHGLLSANSIVGNYIGTATTGEGLPAGLDPSDADSGIGVSKGSRNTVIRANVIGGFNSGISGAIAAGINVTGSGLDTPLDGQQPTGTVITGNYIGVSKGGVRIANRIGIRLGGGEYGPFNTTIGDAGSEAGRNVIAGNAFRGIDLPDTGFIWGDATIAGNFIGLDGNGNAQANGWGSEGGSGPGIFIGLATTAQPIAIGKVTVGPANVISASATYGVRARSGSHVIKGNLLGTDSAGTTATTATANALANVLLENGTGVTVGGASLADRNIMGFNGVVVNPEAIGATNCNGAACASSGHTIEGNYMGVAADGVTPLTATRTQVLSKIGVSLRKTSGNIVRTNVIGGLANGIVLGFTTAGSEANSNQISGNKVGAPASGELIFTSYPSEAQLAGKAPRNYADGIRIFRGSGNTLRNNLISYNARDSNTVDPYAGIRIGTVSSGTAANNNVVEDNRLVRNGNTDGFGIVVDTADNVRLSRNTTQFNAGDGVFTSRGGISLSNGGNNNRAAPTGLSIAAGSPPTLSGTTASCAGCTVEVFGSSLDTEIDEGPVYLAVGTTNGSGGFSIGLPTCLRYLTATVTDASGNTSPFSAQLDTGNPGPCLPVSFTLGASPNPTRDVTPGTTTTYTHTLSHTAPVSLTYTVVFTSSQRWASAPALVTVPPSGSATIIVSVSVPADALATAPAPIDTTDVQVFFGSQGSNAVRDTTRPQAVTINPAQPAVSGPLTQQRAGATVTFNHVVTNTGDLAGTFLVSTPTLSGAPADWTVAAPNPASLAIGPRATGNVALTINTPSLASPSAPVTVTFQVSVQGASPPRVVTQNDFITIPAVRGLTFTHRASEVVTTPAGSSVSFTYSLTNTGNVADNFSVTPTNPAPLTAAVSSSPSLTNLAAGATAAVTVTYSVPSGTTQGAYQATITAQAVGGASPPAVAPRNVTVNVTGGAALALAPNLPLPGPVTPGPGGAVITFTNTLTNTGNAGGAVQINPVTGVPAGWSASILNSTCPVTPTLFAQSASCAFDVEVTVPQGAAGGAVPLGVSATVFNTAPTPNVTATALNTVTVAIARGLQLAPDGLTATAGPGQTVTFTHTLTNTGNAADSFDLSLGQSPGGWTVAVVPATISNLAAGAPRTVLVTARAGAGVTGGVTNTITLTATGQGGGPSASVSDSVSLASVRGGDLLGGGGRVNVDPGGTATYTFTVRNTGTVPLSYTVALTPSLAGWTALAGGVPTAVVQPGLTTTLTVSVTAPADAPAGITNTTTVALLAGDGVGAALDTATALTGIGPRLGVLLDPKGLSGTGRANSTVVLNHTLTNLGSEAGTFVLTSTESLGWDVEISPDSVTLGPGDSVPVQVRVTVKPSATAGARSSVLVRAFFESDPSIADQSLNQVSVPLVVDVALSSSQVRGVPIGATTNLDSLTVFNAGSASDFFFLFVTGESAEWDIILGQSVVPVNTGDPARVSLKVRLAPTVAPGTVRNITVTARSAADGTVRASVNLTLTATGTTTPPPPPPEEIIYLPLIGR